ncbi:NAD(P)/FAD-dependent oxidoreductase [Nocardioides pacificus]
MGGGLGGWRTVTELRRLGYTGSLVLLAEEEHRPYDRPPLSKQVLMGGAELDSAFLADPDEAAALEIDLVLGAAATQVTRGSVETGDASYAWGSLVLATGGSPRLPAFVPAHERVHSLRTRSDAERIAGAMAGAESLLVVGGGFIGMEVAAAGRARGHAVTLIEGQETLAHAGVGREMGLALQELHRSRGVDVLTGSPVVSMTADDRGTEVVTAAGERARGEAAVVGLGIAPRTELLGGAGLDLSDGFVCDDEGRVLGLDGVWAVGDVARWTASDGRAVRREHWSTAVDQAAIVAHALLEEPVPASLRTPPYVWSDQYGLKLQQLGRPELADSQGWLEREGHTGVYGYRRGDSLVAVTTLGPPRLMAPHRRNVMAALAGHLG